MSKLKTNTIRHVDGSNDNITLDSSQNVTAENNLTVDGNLTVSGTSTISGYHPTTSRSNRNLIINGAMNVAQRGTSSTASGYKTVDRFTVSNQNTDESVTQAQVDVTADTDPWNKGFRKAFKITNGNQTSGAGAADEVAVVYNVEAQDLANSGWDYTSTSSNITLSFWVKSSVAQQFQVNMRMYPASGDQKEFCFEYTPSANTWTKVTKTIPGASGNVLRNTTDVGMFIQFPMFYGSNYTANTRAFDTWETKNNAQNYKDYATTWYTTNDATWEMTGLQLEVGDIATDFEHRSYQDELYRCKRYFQGWGSSVRFHDTSSANHATHQYVVMRATPTIVRTGNLYGSYESGSTTSVATYNLNVGQTTLLSYGNSSDKAVGGYGTLSAEL